MKIEGTRYRIWLDDRATTAERAAASHALFRHLVDPPCQPTAARRVAVLAALNLLTGSRTGRARQLADRYRLYISGAWKREKELEELPMPRSAEKVLIHRIARFSNGRSLCARQLLRICAEAPRKP